MVPLALLRRLGVSSCTLVIARVVVVIVVVVWPCVSGNVNDVSSLVIETTSTSFCPVFGGVSAFNALSSLRVASNFGVSARGGRGIVTFGDMSRIPEAGARLINSRGISSERGRGMRGLPSRDFLLPASELYRFYILIP